MANPMREELLKDLCESSAKSELCDAKTFEDCKTARGDCGFCTITADYLLEKGWKKIPVNVGDTVYVPNVKIGAVIKTNVKKIIIDGRYLWIEVGSKEKPFKQLFGKSAFKTEPEAEKVLIEDFHGNGKYDGKVIHCPECSTSLLIKFGRASCFRCKWSASDAELDEIMEGEVDDND